MEQQWQIKNPMKYEAGPSIEQILENRMSYARILMAAVICDQKWLPEETQTETTGTKKRS